MTSYETVYNAFLARILEDEWENWGTNENDGVVDLDEDQVPLSVKQDWLSILHAALPWFKFPRVSLEPEYDGNNQEIGFRGDLSTTEIQIIANYMKCEWLNRSIMTWENVKPLYTERDFSQANLIDKLTKMLEVERKNALALESIYYRSREGKPFNFTKLATRAKDDAK